METLHPRKRETTTGLPGIPSLDATFLDGTFYITRRSRQAHVFETISLYQGIYIMRTFYCDSSELKGRRSGYSMTAIHSRKLSPLLTKPEGENTYKAIWRQN